MVRIPGLNWIQDMLDAMLSDAQAWAKAWGVEAILTKMKQGHFDGVIRDTKKIERILRSMGFSAFRSRWAYIRQLMPLQSRLLVEQILYAMGPPWRRLLTGFNPVELGDVGVLVPWKPAAAPSEDEINVSEEEDVFVPEVPVIPWTPPPQVGGDEPVRQIYRRRWKWRR